MNVESHDIVWAILQLKNASESLLSDCTENLWEYCDNLLFKRMSENNKKKYFEWKKNWENNRLCDYKK